MKSISLFISVTLCSLFLNQALLAQENSDKKDIDMKMFRDSLNIDVNFPGDLSIGTNSTVQQYFDSTAISYYKYKITEFKRANNVLAWQSTSGRIIFWVVLFIVFVGLVFSGIQFFAAAKSNFKMPATELEFSAKGFRLHSSILGVIILVISVAFFYLYLHYVYPVSLLH